VRLGKYLFVSPSISLKDLRSKGISLLADFRDCKKRAAYLKVSASRVFNPLKINPDSQQIALVSAS